MQIHELEPGFAISDALVVEDLEEVVRLGFKSIVCNRRPGEADGQSDESLMHQRCLALGLAWRCIPVAPGEYGEADIEAFGTALEELPPPILAFCRTGRRAVHMWAHARSCEPGCDIPALLEAAHQAGHDPQPIHDMLNR
ncbi:TIGR01244 family sulfur transferase [Halomonas sp. 18H]|nr:TIGR01244 family sulfur transferase [Halomonas sp. 18H]MCW4152741.1 TIGR01244 family sulfur transferase [Halomonas sp. 18H]